MKRVTFLTNKENLLYLAVLAGAVFLIFVGVWLCEIITDGAEQNARKYQTATRIMNDQQLNHSIDTKHGNILAEVTIKSADLVKFPEMNKSFAKVEKTEERYTEHEREVCETYYRTETRTRTEYDAEGNSYEVEYTVEVPYEECHTETYYEWDYVQEWSETAKEVNMADRKYSIDLFSLSMNSIDAKDIINGQEDKYVYDRTEGGLFGRAWFSEDTVGDKRYSYRVMELPQSGTVFLNVSETLQPVSGGRIDLQSRSPEELVKSAQDAVNTQTTIFTVLWSILVLAELIGLGYVVYQYQVR